MTEQQPAPGGITGILDALDAALRAARPLPMSSSVLVNRAELSDLVSQAREGLPRQLTRADEVLAAADAERAEAVADGQRIVAQARARAAELVEEDALVQQARRRAAEIVAEAQQLAEELRRGADDYSDRRLADLEIELGRVLAQVQAGRARLAGRLGPPLG